MVHSGSHVEAPSYSWYVYSKAPLTSGRVRASNCVGMRRSPTGGSGGGGIVKVGGGVVEVEVEVEGGE